MIEYQIENVTPTLVDDVLFSVSFTLVGVEGDLREEIHFRTPSSLPDREQPYVQDDYIELAGSIALAVGLYDVMVVRIEEAKKSLVVVPPIEPPLDPPLPIEEPIEPPPPPIPPTPTTTPTITTLEQKTKWMTQIDNTIALVYNQFTRFQMEYELREAAALEYKNGDYTGEPSMWLKSFADNTGISYRQCANVVLSQADKLRGAVALLGILRMDKYKVLSAPTLEDAQDVYNVIQSKIKNIAGGLS